MFYSNLSFGENVIHSCVRNVDIDNSLEGVARILHLSCEGANIFHLDFDGFEYFDGETALTASRLLNDDDNPALVDIEVKYYTLSVQVLAKIVFYNLLLKSGKYSHARGFAPLLIYYLLKGIRVNISKHLIDFMLLEHFMIPSRNHPCGMTFTHLLKYFKIDVSDENVFPPSVNIDCTLLKRMQASTRAHAQPPNSAFTTICF